MHETCGDSDGIATRLADARDDEGENEGESERLAGLLSVACPLVARSDEGGELCGLTQPLLAVRRKGAVWILLFYWIAIECVFHAVMGMCGKPEQGLAAFCKSR